MSDSNSSSASMQADGGQPPQQQATNVNAATAIIGALPTGQPVTGQQAIDAAAVHDRELADLRQQNLQLQQSQQQMQQQLQQLLLNQQQPAAANIAVAQQHPAAAPAASPQLKRRAPELMVYRGSRDRTPIRDWLRDTEEVFEMTGTPLNLLSTIHEAGHYLKDDAKTWYNQQKASIHTWDDFRNVLIERYRDPHEVMKARNKLASVKQTGSVSNTLLHSTVLAWS